MRRAAAIVVLVVSLVLPLTAQAPTPPTTSEADAPTVYLMTMGPGQYVWERFGHNALWIHDPARGTDLAYNYGLFDFRQENFVLRFVQGRMWYWMDGAPVDYYLRQYQRDNRSIWIQELNLTPRQRIELRDFLEHNALPDNRYYRYDYYRDNCSTRVRDALNLVLGGTLRAQTESVAVASTYRSHTQRLTANDVPIYTGLLAAIGPGGDRPLSAWDEMFLPLAMREHVRTITVPGPDGRPMPLVASERTIYESTAAPPLSAPPRWLPWYLLVGLTIGLALVAASRRVTTSGLARAAVAVLGGIWGSIGGLAGLVLAGMWLATDHTMTYRNVNLFYLDPVVIVLAVVLPAAAYGKAWARRAVAPVALVATGVALLGVVVEMLPGMNQVNGQIVALTLPIHLGVAVAARALRDQSDSRMPSIAASTANPGAARSA